jgi:translation initiation factor IF-1
MKVMREKGFVGVNLAYMAVCILSCLAFSNLNAQQTTRVSGKVVDAVSKTPIPFVNVLFKGTFSGTVTDEDGNYVLDTKLKSDTLIVSAIGFVRQNIRIKNGDNNKVDVQLQPDELSLTAVIVKYQGNPAEKILKKVIDKKPVNDIRSYQTLSYESYQKIEVDVYNISKLVQNNFLTRPFKFMFEYMDSSADGRKFLPSFITESVSDRYMQKTPEFSKEVIRASKIAGNGEDKEINQFTGEFYTNFNIYKDFIVISNKSFVSPIANSGIFFYKYYLADSIENEQGKFYKLDYFPRRKQDYTFNGYMWIHDSTFAVESIKFMLSEEVNVNFIRGLDAEQKYMQVDGHWVMESDRVLLDLNPLTKKSIGVIGRKYGHYDQYKFNEKIPDSIARNPNNIIMLDDILEKSTTFWDTARAEPLTIREQGIYVMIDSLKKNKTYKAYEKVGNVLLTGYIPLKYVEFGQYYKFYSFNPIEGSRAKLGFRTSPNLSKRFFMYGHLAYGFKDKQWKQNLELYYHLNADKIPWRLVGFQYRNDLEQFSVTEKSLEHDNILNSLLRRSSFNNLLRVKKIYGFYEHEWFQGLTNMVEFEHREVQPVGNIQFQRGSDPTKYYTKLVTTEFTFSLHFALKEKYILRRVKRTPTGTKWPIVDIKYTLGVKNLWQANFGYHKLLVTIDDRIRINPIGYLDYYIEAGKIWGATPWPFLFNHNGNNSYFYDRFAFNRMNTLEFVSDEYFSIKVEHHFDGALFNRIPGFRKLKWREVVTASALYGSMRNYDAHKQLVVFPQYIGQNIKPSLQQPYYEVGFGIENIFRIFRVDFTWRLSNLNRDLNGDGANDRKVSPFGVQGSFKFNL